MGVKFNPFTGNLDLIDTTAAAGADTQVQFNNGGNLAGSADLTWDDTGKELGVGGDINLDDGGTYATTLQLITPTANRTISFPDATGTVGLVGGSSGQLIYNNAGAYAGASSTSVGASGDITLSLAGAASTPPVSLTGTWFSGGTSTTTKPQLLIEPTGTTSTAWSTSGTGLGVNAASGFGGNLLDLQVNGSSKLYVNNDGNIAVPAGSQSAPSLTFTGDPNTGIYSPGADQVAISTNGTGRLFVDASGRIGVGATPSGTGQFHVINTAGNVVSQFLSQPSGTCTIYLGTTSTADSFLQYDDSASFLRWYEGGSERFRIDSSGRLGLGTTSPSTLLTLSEDQGTAITLRRNNSAAVDDDLVGKIDFFNNDSSSPGARVTATVGAYAQSTAGGTYLAFSTATNGGSNAERLRIDQAGNVGIGTTSPGVKIHIEESLTSGTDQAIQRITTAQGGSFNIRCSDLSSAAPDWEFFTGNSEDIVFSPSSSEKARIDSSGRLLVGTTTSSDAKAKLKVAGSVNVAAGDNSVIIAAGATSTIATPARGYSYINISSSNTSARGLLLLVFADTNTLTIVSTIDDRTSAEYSASVSGRNLQVTNALGIGVTLHAACMTLAHATDG